MKAIILAAGQGSRLRPLTDNCPKAMVSIAGQTLLDRQIERFNRFGIQEIIVVGGYCAESIESRYHFMKSCNKDYKSTNMAYSLFCAKEHLQGEVIISYGDILYDDSVLRAVIASSKDVSVAADLGWEPYYTERFGDPYADAESLVYDQAYSLQSIGKPNPTSEEVMAQFIGLIKLTACGSSMFHQLYNQINNSEQLIGWGRTFPKAYMTDFLQELIYRRYPVHAVPIRRGWFEIDQMTDYDLAVNNFS